ncbi:MAG: tRNA (guanosine(37)-N1)-methyltransferase TrmD [Oscillospiraceae bacterium]|jgi:tRNA (guanine37-N1)-methyltransferase|nr:tRNA (guanosine(37)-N1)-methyltransferase TrmD [Oscillospiraceae bacterium]
MRIKILTLFPEMFRALDSSIVGRARRSGLISIETIDIRSFTKDKHRKTDDYAFGGGPGLVMYAQPIIDAMGFASRPPFDPANGRRVSLSPRGTVLNQRAAERLARYDDLILLCGHYEGIDQRALDACVDEEISIGDYILTGGEPAAIVLIDAVARLIPGVLGSIESARDESFSSDGLLEYPQYTHPRVVGGVSAPDVLLSGNHAAIAAWKREQSLRVTLERRPELLERAALTDKERRLIESWRQNGSGTG